MMHDTHDVHSWSKLYREERLAEARGRRLAERAVSDEVPRGLRRLRLAWGTQVGLAAAEYEARRIVGAADGKRAAPCARC